MLKQVIDLFELLDDPAASGQGVKDLFAARGFGDCVEVQTLEGPKGTTDFVRIIVKGSELTRVPTTPTTVSVTDAKKVQRLADRLEDLEDVQNVYNTMDVTDEIAAALDED